MNSSYARSRTRLARTWASLAILVVVIVATAEAHTALRKSAPSKGAHLTVAPRVLSLTFSEEIALPMTKLRLVAADSQEIALGALTHPGDSAKTIAADVTGPLHAGAYVMHWQTAGEDGHPVRGEVGFTIEAGATGIAAANASPPRDTTTAPAALAADTAHATDDASSFDASSPAFAAVRWFGYVALLALIGAVVFRLAVVARVARSGAAWVGKLVPGLDRSATSVGMTAAGALLLASLLELIAESRAANMGSTFDVAQMIAMVGGTKWGLGWMLRGAGALIALGGLALAKREGREGVGGTGLQGWGLAAIGSVLAVFGQPHLGHASAAPSYRGLMIFTDGVHLIGAGGWLGTLLALVIIGLREVVRLEPRARGEATMALVRTFSPVALICASLVAVSGIVQSISRVGSIDAFTGSGYGRLLLLKLALVAFVVAFGAINWRKLTPMLGTDAGAARLRRSATTELALGALVLAVTSVLAATSPPGYERHDDDDAVSAPTRFDDAQLKAKIDSVRK